MVHSLDEDFLTVLSVHDRIEITIVTLVKTEWHMEVGSSGINGAEAEDVIQKKRDTPTFIRTCVQLFKFDAHHHVPVRSEGTVRRESHPGKRELRQLLRPGLLNGHSVRREWLLYQREP